MSLFVVCRSFHPYTRPCRCHRVHLGRTSYAPSARIGHTDFPPLQRVLAFSLVRCCRHSARFPELFTTSREVSLCVQSRCAGNRSARSNGDRDERDNTLRPASGKPLVDHQQRDRGIAMPHTRTPLSLVGMMVSPWCAFGLCIRSFLSFSALPMASSAS